MDNNKIYAVGVDNSMTAFTDINEAKAYCEQNKSHEIIFSPANIDTTKYANGNTYSFVFKITVFLNDESIKNRIGFEFNHSSVDGSVIIKASNSIITLHHNDISLVDIINDKYKNDYIKTLGCITAYPYIGYIKKSKEIYDISYRHNFSILIVESGYDLDHVLYEAAFRLKLFIDGIVDRNIDINDNASLALYSMEFTNNMLNTELTNDILNSDIEKVDEVLVKKILDKAKDSPTYKYLSFSTCQCDNAEYNNSNLMKNINIDIYLRRAVENEIEKAIYDNKPIDEDYICGKVIADLVGEVYNVK